MLVKEEIRVRRKEKCKRRSEELHNKEIEERENKQHKRRKTGITGEYETVYTNKREEMRERAGKE